MDKARLEELRAEAERRCTELFNQVTGLQTELERTRGDYRTYDSLLLNWKEPEPATEPDKKPKEK